MRQLSKALPPGLEWAIFRGVAVPVPSEWNQLTQESTFVSSVESIKKKGIFETGLTIQVIENIQKEYKAPASIAALNLYRDVKNETDNKILSSSAEEKNGIKVFVFTYENTHDLADPVKIHKVVFANDSTSVIDIVTFESPIKTWEKYWEQYGKNMLNKIILLKPSN